MTRISLQELCYMEAARANRAENELKNVRKQRENARRNVRELEQKLARLQAEIDGKRARGRPHLSHYHRYWIDRFTPDQIAALAAGLEAPD